MSLVKTTVFSALLVCLLMSALAVIYSKYRIRQVFSEIQRMEKRLDQFEIEWSRLQLELTMLTQENRVEVEARERLKLVLPEREEIIYLRP